MKISSSIRFVVFLMAVGFFFGTGLVQNLRGSDKVTTSALVLETRPYRKSTSPRLWIKYEYTTQSGERRTGAKARYVANLDAVKPGDTITVSYSRKKPSRSSITSNSPPSPQAVETQTKKPDGGLNTLWLGLAGLLVAAATYFGLSKIVNLLRSLGGEALGSVKGAVQSRVRRQDASSSTPSADNGRDPWSDKPEHATPPAARKSVMERGSRTGRAPKKVVAERKARDGGRYSAKPSQGAVNKRKSKVKVRAGWFS